LEIRPVLPLPFKGGLGQYSPFAQGSVWRLSSIEGRLLFVLPSLSLANEGLFLRVSVSGTFLHGNGRAAFFFVAMLLEFERGPDSLYVLLLSRSLKG